MCFTNVVNSKIDRLGRSFSDNFDNEISDKCDYIDIDETTTLALSSDDLILTQWNIRGLISKQHSISRILGKCFDDKSIDVVMLAETWLTDQTANLLDIPGYVYEGKHRQTRKGGGVGFLINESIRYKTRRDIVIDCEVMEYIIIEVKLRNRNVLVASIYRPPNTNQTQFISEYNTLVKRLKQETSKELVIGLDHNMDLMKCHLNAATQRFVDVNLNENLSITITKPTRITKTTATLLDNIISTHALAENSESCILISDLSDHLPCLLIVKDIKGDAVKPKNRVSRSLNDKHVDTINERLKSYNWDSLLLCNNVDDDFDTFHNILVQTVDEVAPERIITTPTKCKYKEPWLTKGVMKCIGKQRLLYKATLHVNASENDHAKYKQY